MHYRFRWTVLGGHTHVRVFVGKARDLTHGKAGDLTFTNAEWQLLSEGLSRIGCEIIADDMGDPDRMCGCRDAPNANGGRGPIGADPPGPR